MLAYPLGRRPPQGVGRVERYNRDYKEQGLRLTDVQTLQDQRQELDLYRRFYNVGCA